MICGKESVDKAVKLGKGVNELNFRRFYHASEEEE